MSLSVPAREGPDRKASDLLQATVGSALSFSACQVVPSLVLVAIVSPLPLILQRLRAGLGSALFAALTASALIAAVFSPGPALLYFFFLAAPGLLIGEAMARGRGLRRGCAWAFALIGLEIGLALLLQAPDMASAVSAAIEPYRSPQFLAEMRESLPPEQVDAWLERWTRLQSALAVVYPAAYVILGGLIVLANGTLLGVYLARRDPGWLEGGEFEGIRWPLALTGLFVLGGAMVVFEELRAAGYNVLLVVAFFYVLQGLAVVVYFANRLAGPRLLRIALVLLVVMNPWREYVLGLLGLFDTWGDFRRFADPPEAEDD